MNRKSFFLTEGTCEPAYENLRDLAKVEHHRQFVERLWVTYAPYSDDHFLSDARSHLQERFWEMYLGCTLLENGFALINPSTRGPEFFCKINGGRCWFEAIAPGAGTGADSVPEMEYGAPVARRVPEDEIILRLRHAIHEKYQKYQKDVRTAGLSQEDAYVIAINSKRVQPIVFDSTLPLIVKAVFPFGDLTVSIDTRSGDVVDQYHNYRDKIIKCSGNPVSTDVFLDNKYSGISAVLYSSVDVANYPPTLGADFRLVHNPLAQIPIKHGAFPFGTEYWMEGDKLKWKRWTQNPVYRDRE